MAASPGTQDQNQGSERLGHQPRSHSKCHAGRTTKTQSGTPGRRGWALWGPRAGAGSTCSHPPPPACPPRLLEADSKSMRSMNGSRRNSGSSLVSSSSASSNLSDLEEVVYKKQRKVLNQSLMFMNMSPIIIRSYPQTKVFHNIRKIFTDSSM